MKNTFQNLFKVKTILSVLFSVTTCYLAVTEKIEMETFMTVTMSIITYYFTKTNNDE